MRRFLRMGAAVATLCWGSGAMGQAGPVPIDPTTWVTQDDYPGEAMAKREQGVVNLTMDVNELGQVSACHIVQSSGSTILDQLSCRLMVDRGRFEPATDVRGKPVAAHRERRIRWQLPEETLEALQPRAFTTRVTSKGKGVIERCKTDSSDPLNLRIDACQQHEGRYVMLAGMKLADYPAGTLSISIRREVDTVPFVPDPKSGAVSDVPPYFTSEDRLTVAPNGTVIECVRRVSAGPADALCPPYGPFQPDSDGRERHVIETLSMAFQPAK